MYGPRSAINAQYSALCLPQHPTLPAVPRHHPAPRGLGEDDDDPLLDDGEVDMRAVMVAGGVMEFELLRLPPQSKTVGP